MRIKAEQLTQQLRKQLSPLYIVQGDETLLVQEACDLIRHHARQLGYTERDIHAVEGRFDWTSLLAASQHLSLFSERRILELRIPSGKPGTEGGKVLQQLAVHLPPDTLTLITLPKLDRSGSNSKWFTALETNGISIPVLAVGIDALPRWISERLQQQQQHADAQALQLISEKVEGNLIAAQQEISKLGLLYPIGPLSLDQIRDAVLNVARFDVFKLSDAWLMGDRPRLVRMLQGLYNEGEAATLVLWSISRELRLLVKLIGTPTHHLNQRMREIGIWDNRQALFTRALRRIKPEQLRKALQRTAAIDRMIKGLDERDPWLEIEQLTLDMAT